MKKGANKPEPIQVGDIVKAVFADLEREKDLTKEEIEERWKKIAGDAAFKHTRPVSLRKSTLTVFVDSSTWMQEMRFKKRFLLKQLKSTFGKDKISGIQFRIGEI
jgi:predicted nucleic acid-binding Zn ribbon protein